MLYKTWGEKDEKKIRLIKQTLSHQKRLIQSQILILITLLCTIFFFEYSSFVVKIGFGTKFLTDP